MSAAPVLRAYDQEIAVRVRGLRTQFGDKVVHEHLDLDVRRGEVLAVIGPSGCGKSVLLREIVGLDKPSAGSVEVFGSPMTDPGERSRRIGVMFQDGALFSKLTLKENVEVPLKEHTTLPRELISELADLKLIMAGLTGESHHLRPAQISGGMRKRAALARALALDPELLMLDEPTAGLDPVTAGNFDRLLGELSKALKLTVFLVTHDLDTLYETADRICVLHGGKVAVIGTIDEVLASENAWVKEYFRGPRGRAAQHAHEGAEAGAR